MTLWQRVPDLPNCQFLMDTVSSDMMLHERQPVSRSVSMVVICQGIVTHSNYCKCKTLPINTIDGQFVFGDYQTSIGLSVVCVLHGETSG